MMHVIENGNRKMVEDQFGWLIMEDNEVIGHMDSGAAAERWIYAVD